MATTDINTAHIQGAQLKYFGQQIRAKEAELRTAESNKMVKKEEGKSLISAEDIAKIGANANLIATLIGEDNGKSVRTIATEELVKQLIPENANESRDTLEEISAWIQQHPEDASAMNAAIAALQARLGTVYDLTSATFTETAGVVNITSTVAASLLVGNKYLFTVTENKTAGSTTFTPGKLYTMEVYANGDANAIRTNTAWAVLEDQTVLAFISDFSDKIAKINASLETINGSASTPGSVDYKINAALSNYTGSIEYATNDDIDAMINEIYGE